MDLMKTADYIVKQMWEEGVAVHRYDAMTSRSIYLKFDFGVACSLRISDHKGYKHLKYRYNLMEDAKGKRYVKDTYPRYYYGMDAIEQLIRDILQERHEKMVRFGVYYDELVKKNMAAQKRGTSKFWRGATEVAPYCTTRQDLHAAVRNYGGHVVWDTGQEESKH